MERKGICGRGLISLLTLGSFIAMSLTGIVLFFTPPGRIAYWIDWRFWGLTKEDWVNIHTICCFFFVVVGVWHLVYNWRALLNHLISKVPQGLRLRKEIAWASAILLLVILGPLYQWPFFKTILDFGDRAKRLGVSGRNFEPPLSHAEQLSLRTLANKMKIDLDQALGELKSKGIRVESPDDSLQRIAKANQTSPMKIYSLIQKFETAPPSPGKRGKWTTHDVEEKFGGRGMGRKTLAEVTQELGLDLPEAQRRLSKNGITLQAEDTLHEGAKQKNVSPMDLLKVLLVEDYRLP